MNRVRISSIAVVALAGLSAGCSGGPATKFDTYYLPATVTAEAKGSGAGCHDVAADFSVNSNPYGPWTCGYLPSAGGSFNAATYNVVEQTNEFWSQIQSDATPGCSFNQTGAEQHPAPTNTMAANQYAMHPGPQGQVAVTRFTAPAAGQYSVDVAFVGLDGYQGAPVSTTDVAVQLDGTGLYSAGINVQNGGNQAEYQGTVSMQAGSVLDVMVGWGNGDYAYDLTGVSIHVCPK